MFSLINEETYPEAKYRFEIGGICQDYPHCEHYQENLSPTLAPIGELLKEKRGILLENYCLFCSVFADSEQEITKELILQELQAKLKCDEAHVAFFDTLLHSYHVISKEVNTLGGITRQLAGCCIAGGTMYDGKLGEEEGGKKA